MRKPILHKKQPATPLPREFRDSLGRVWRPFITCQTLTDFEEQTGESLFNPETLAKLRGKSMKLLMSLAFLACDKQINEMTPPLEFRDFTAGFTRADQIQTVTLAMAGAIERFFQSQQTDQAAQNLGTGATSTN